MKKELLLGVVIFAVLFSMLVSAYPSFDFESASNQIIDWIRQIFGPFFAAFLGGDTNLLFEKVLFLLLLISFIFAVLSKLSLFEGRTGVLWIVTIIVSVLSTRFLTETQVIHNILLPYSVLGVAMTAAIPLVVFFFFAQGFESGLIRKVLWIFFIIVFFGLWGERYSELGQLSWIYFLTGIIALIFLFADGTIRRILIKQQMAQLGINRREDFERDIQRQIFQADKDLANTIITPSQHAYIKRRLQKQLKAIRKN